MLSTFMSRSWFTLLLMQFFDNAIQPFLKIDNIYVLVYLESMSFHQYSQVTTVFQLSLKLLLLYFFVKLLAMKVKPSCIDGSH